VGTILSDAEQAVMFKAARLGCPQNPRTSYPQILRHQDLDYDLGYFDLDMRVLEQIENPFGPKLLPMS
jgi:hypothetical protein